MQTSPLISNKVCLLTSITSATFTSAQLARAPRHLRNGGHKKVDIQAESGINHLQSDPSNELRQLDVIPSDSSDIPTSGPTKSFAPSTSSAPSYQPSASAEPSFQPSTSSLPSYQPSFSTMPSYQPSKSSEPSSNPSTSSAPSIKPTMGPCGVGCDPGSYAMLPIEDCVGFYTCVDGTPSAVQYCSPGSK